jgi:outer membrane cobalamin receptor
MFRNEMGVPGIAYADPSTFALLGPDGYNGTVEKQASTPLARQKQNTEYVRLEHHKAWEVNSLRTTAYASDDRLNYRNPDWGTNSDYHSQVVGGELQFNTLYGITAGTEWNEEMYRNTDLIAAADVIDRSRVNTAVYLQEALKLSAFSFIPGLRLDANSAFGSVVSPRLTVVFHANERVKFSANTGKVWRAPTFNELYYKDAFGTSGDPNLKPEEGISSDFGVEYARESWKSSCTLFRSDTDNLILWKYDSATFTSTAMNVNRSRQQGAEFEFSQQLVKGLAHRLNYTYLWAEDTDAHTQLIYRPQHTANYALTWAFPSGTRLGMGAEYVGAKRTEAADYSMSDPRYYSELPAYTLVSLTVSQRFHGAELWMRGDNLLNTNYQTRLGYPLPGAVISGGVNIRFQG